MGISYYNCSRCDEIFADCGDWYYCHGCCKKLCGQCKSYVVKVLAVCDGNCVEGFSSVVEEDDNSEEEEEGEEEEKPCTCIPYIIQARKRFSMYEYFCRECLTVDAPFDVSDRKLIRFLLRGTPYRTIGQARMACGKQLKKEKEEEDE